MNQNDQLVFADEETFDANNQESEGYKILLVDDEPAVHDVTLLALNGYQFNDKNAHFLHAYSAEEAKIIFEQHDDIAIALVDVVMETDQAGIDLVQWVRREHKNHLVRLILRTGQPGQAPERKVIVNCDINDYKEKTELTSNKLFTLVTTSLRSYESLKALEKSRNGLKLIIESSRGLSTHGSIESFVQGVLTQLQAIFGVEEAAFYCDRVDDELNRNIYSDFLVIAGKGNFSGTQQFHLSDIKDSPLEQGIKESLLLRESHFDQGSCYIYFTAANDNHCVLYFNRLQKALDSTEKDLIDVFCNNINFAFDNLTLNREIDNGQRETVFTLGTIAEFRSKETGRHIVRVSKYAEKLGQLYGLSSEDAELLLKAMPMHDVGKIAIQDNILHKRDSLTVSEMDVMKQHPQIGYDMLKSSKRPLFNAAAIIALQHHERWDGNGYPEGLSGQEIHLYGRIAAIVDVFDALSNERCYKPAWPHDQVVEYIKQERGKHFDPHLVDLMLDNIEQFVEISQQYEDVDSE